MTNDDRQARLVRILQEAQDLPVTRREVFVVEACGDDRELMGEIVDLLSRDESVSGFLDAARDSVGRLPGVKTAAAAADLVSRIYDQLHRLAEQRRQQERSGQGLTAAALVNEAWLHPEGEAGTPVHRSRRRFYLAAAEAMRRVFIDHARARGQVKPTGGRKRSLPDSLDLAVEWSLEETLELDDAIRCLEQDDFRAGQTVRLRFFAGLSVEETAEIVEESPRTVMGDWAYARAWLVQTLEERDPQPKSS